MNSFFDLVHTLINVDAATINSYAHALGPWLYVVLFAIVFAETGLVVTPFLPGDSLLFAVGAVAAHPDSPIRLGLVAAPLVIAAVLGDAINYAVGRYVGPRVFSRQDSWLLNQKHLVRAHQFYEDYGGVTIILARFIPIVRTFAPFVAGIGRMTYSRFAIYNVTGGVVWILLFLLAGWKFGTGAIVQRNFKLVIVAIVVISVLPAVFEIVRARLGQTAATGPWSLTPLRPPNPPDRATWPLLPGVQALLDPLVERLLEFAEWHRIERSPQ